MPLRWKKGMGRKDEENVAATKQSECVTFVNIELQQLFESKATFLKVGVNGIISISNA
jgi:hypothetical protein